MHLWLGRWDKMSKQTISPKPHIPNSLLLLLFLFPQDNIRDRSKFIGYPGRDHRQGDENFSSEGKKKVKTMQTNSLFVRTNSTERDCLKFTEHVPGIGMGWD